MLSFHRFGQAEPTRKEAAWTALEALSGRIGGSREKSDKTNDRTPEKKRTTFWVTPGRSERLGSMPTETATPEQLDRLVDNTCATPIGDRVMKCDKNGVEPPWRTSRRLSRRTALIRQRAWGQVGPLDGGRRRRRRRRR